MKRWFAFFCSMMLAASLFLGNAGTVIQAKEEPEKAECLNTPEEMAMVFAQKGASAALKSTKDIHTSQEVIRKRVIVKTSETIADTYGATDVYFYAPGGYQILFYQTVAQAERACAKLKKEYAGTLVFQDIPVTMKDDDSGEEAEAFDGIHQMGMDQLKEEAKDWKGDVEVAVIDSGIDTDHPWFTDRLDRKNSINFAADIEDPTAYNDTTQGHGTHVAGIITQATPEQVKVMAIRVFDLTGSASYATITLAVDYAVEHNAAVINMSLGFEIASGFESDDTELMDEAFARALAAGSTVCVASGNEFTDTSKSYPASSRWTIAVGSLEEDQEKKEYIRSDFSNNGPLLDFVAPGRNIYSAWIGDGEATMIASGTSMATPHLAAAAAYVKLKHPSYNQREVYAEFRDYAVDLGEPGKDSEFGYGYVDMSEYARKESDGKKKYQAITADAQINKTMNEAGKPFPLEAKLTRGGGTLSYRSTDEKVAKVEKGMVQVTGVGTCDIIITASGTAKDCETEQAVKIRVTKGQQTITVPVQEYVRKVSDKHFQVTASIEQPGDGKLIFLANENDVVEVNEDGYVTILGPGTTQIYAVAKATDNFVRQVSDAITIRIEKDPEVVPEEKTQPAPSPTPITTPMPVPENREEGKQTESPSNVAGSPVKAKKMETLEKTTIKKVKIGKNKAKIIWKKINGAEGYQIRYATKKTMKNAKIRTTKKKSNGFIPWKKGKKYYVQIRAFYTNEAGVKQFAKWSRSQSIKERTGK